MRDALSSPFLPAFGFSFPFLNLTPIGRSLAVAMLAAKIVRALSLSSNVVFDTSKVYTERDTRTRREFIIGVRLLRSRDERRTQEREGTMLREQEDQRLHELGDFLRTRRARL